MNPSPLRYPGGKHKIYRYISDLVSRNECSTYIEPFCGGAALAFDLLFDGVVNDIIINDFDYSVFCFWHCVLANPESICRKIRDTAITLDEWHRQKDIRKHLDDCDELDIGFSTLFLNRTNRSGIIDKAGPIGGLQKTGNYPIDCRFNKDTLIAQIKRIAESKNHIQVYNMEALDFIDDIICKSRKSFIYFDPPYYSKGPGLYTNFYSHGDHQNLSRAIMEKLKRRKWIVSYDNVNAVKSMYAKADSIEFKLQYSLQSKKDGTEVMFFSKNVARPENEHELINIV